MLTSILTVSIIALALLLPALRFARSRSTRRKTAYVCDICNEQNCLCRKKP